MVHDPMIKRSRRSLRWLNVICALFFGSVAAWMFSRGYDWILATLCVGAALFALIEAIVKSR